MPNQAKARLTNLLPPCYASHAKRTQKPILPYSRSAHYSGRPKSNFLSFKMSYTISIAKAAPDIWMINNVLFRWYAALLRERFGGDEDVLSEIDIAEAMHGVSLGSLIREDFKLALKLRDAFRAVALEITRGQHTFPETDIDAKQVIQSFEELVRILDRLKV